MVSTSAFTTVKGKKDYQEKVDREFVIYFHFGEATGCLLQAARFFFVEQN